MKLSYPAGGWLPQNAHFELKWDDQGRDFATNWAGPIQAPGNGECVLIASDQPFPNGFGPHYPIVRIDTGPWAGHQYYLGHTTAVVQVGQRFSFGQVLSHANQGHDWAGTTGGWCELGEWFPGQGPGPKQNSHWFDNLISTPLVVTVPDPPLKWGDSGWRVLGMTSDLRNCGWLKRPYWKFGTDVHGAVVAFKTYHHIPMPPLGTKQDRGIANLDTLAVIKHSGDSCKKNKKKER